MQLLFIVIISMKKSVKLLSTYSLQCFHICQILYVEKNLYRVLIKFSVNANRAKTNYEMFSILS